MSHKDWKGPGFYDCWDLEGVWRWRDEKFSCEGLSKGWAYQIVPGWPPKPPKPELPDGVYAVRTKGHYNPDVFLIGLNELKDGKWNRKPGPNDTILGRIPIEEVDQ
jgi:hypothetical protein